MSQPFVKLENLSKTLGKQKVIDNLSLEMQRGDFMVVFGPSGVGKTTLLRLIAGAMRPDSGEVYLDGQAVTQLEPEFRGVAMAFQSFALYPHMSAYENIASPLRAHGFDAKDIDRRVYDIGRLLKIEHVLTHAPGTLSNGQKQRTALARSLICEPAIVLLDDPLRNVDAKLRYEMRLELPHILRRYQATMIYVTQDFKEAMALGDRVSVMLDGRVRQVDSPAGIYQKPRDVDVARLFGDPPINTLSVRPRKNGRNGMTVSIAGRDLPAPGCPVELADRDCYMGLRPEHISLVDHSGDDTVSLRLEAVLPLNVRTALALQTDDDTELMASAWDVRADLSQRQGEQVSARIDLSRAVFFDADSGGRVAQTQPDPGGREAALAQDKQ